MPHIETVTLPEFSPGTSRRLAVYRFGKAGARPKVYIQAGIHADELPANLVAHHLIGRLTEKEANGDIRGEIVVVPVANPVGLSNVQLNDHQGRYHATSGENYNRSWPDVADRAVRALGGRLGSNATENLATLHKAIAAELERIEPKNEAEVLRLRLMQLAFDADIVLDLHTDDEAEMHLFVDHNHWPGAADLASLLAVPVVILARDSGNHPFEETVALPYLKVAEQPGGRRLLTQPLTVVVELRGESDVCDGLAARDAAALERFLIAREIIKGDAGRIAAFEGIAAGFEATEVLRAPAAGIIVYKCEIGSMIVPDETIAEIVDPLKDGDAARVSLKAESTGRFFARSSHRLAWPGLVIGKIHGTEALAGREKGDLLYD